MLSPHLATTYPKLRSDGGRETSPKDPRYNCIAWAAAWDTTRWWQPERTEPGMYWPDGVADDGSLQCFIDLFQSLGYSKCAESNLEILYEKVAIYENLFGHF